MTSAAVVLDRKLFSGTAAAGASPFFDVAVPTDKALFLRAHVFLTALSVGNLIAVGGLVAEYVIYNNNGSLTAPTAITTSSNPQNSANLIAVWAEAEDPVLEGIATPSTAVWSHTGTVARLTVTNNGVQDADVTITVDVINFSSV